MATFELQDDVGQTVELFEAGTDEDAVGHVRRLYEASERARLLLLRQIPLDDEDDSAEAELEERRAEPSGEFAVDTEATEGDHG